MVGAMIADRSSVVLPILRIWTAAPLARRISQHTFESPFMTRRLAFALLLLALSVHAQQTDLMQQNMGQQAFAQAGLQKLSPDELKFLDQWLTAHAAQLAAAVPASAAPTAKAASGSASAHNTIQNHVAGRFRGWQSGDVLQLANGQRWRVIDNSSLNIGRVIDAPAVTIKPGLLGGWLLKVNGYNASARVEPAN
jgi:hypothetical protein